MDEKVVYRGALSQKSLKTPGLGDEGDYEEWLAHSAAEGGGPEDPAATDGCVLGLKETFRRLRRLSVCRNGRDYMVNKRQSACVCTRDDYLW